MLDEWQSCPTFMLHDLCISWLRENLRWKRPVPRTFSWLSMVPGPQPTGPCLSRLDVPLEAPSELPVFGVFVDFFLLNSRINSTVMHCCMILNRSHARPSARIKIQSFWCLERSPRTLESSFSLFAICIPEDLHQHVLSVKLAPPSGHRFNSIWSIGALRGFCGGCFLLGLPWSHRSLGSLRHCVWGLEASSSPDFLRYLKPQIVKHLSIAFTWIDDLFVT